MHQITAPALIVWRDRDNLIPLHCGHEFARLIPGSTLSVYADTGHNAMIERPRRFNAELAAFMGKTPAPQPAELTGNRRLSPDPYGIPSLNVQHTVFSP